MMRFSKSQTGSDLLESCPKEFKAAVGAFFKAIESLPSHQLFEMCGGEMRIKTQLVETVAQELKETSQRAKKIKEDFIAGKYDEQVFSDNPQLTAELKVMVAHYHRDFVTTLFCKCQSEKQVNFWMSHTSLPPDALALAVHLGNNIHVLHYLKEKGCLTDLDPDDKKQLLLRANRFDNEGLAYLKEQFSLGSVAKLS